MAVEMGPPFVRQNNLMKIFLIHVRKSQHDAFPWKTRIRNGFIRVIGFPPLGIMSLSAVLKRAGHECVMFDQADPRTPNEVIIEEIRRQQPALVGISFLSTTCYPHAKILARQIRAADANVLLAFGGLFASLNAAHVKLQCPEVDFVCHGDGEQLILDLVENLDDPAAVASLTWTKDGVVVHNPYRPLEPDLDQWPFPDRESLKIEFVESMPLDVPVILSEDRFTIMQTSRGCPWSCVFCDVPVFGEGKWRARSPQHVLAELDQLERLGYRSVYFVDENFLLKSARIDKICAGIIKKGIGIRWGCEGRVDSAVEHLFPTMAAAHCHALMFGIESGSQKVLDCLGKRHNLQDVEHAVRNAKQAGIEMVHGFFVVGSPDETVDDIRDTFRFAAKLKLDTFSFNRLCVYRGSPLWDEYVKRGLIDDEADWFKYLKCSEIDPTCLSGKIINRERVAGFMWIFLYKLTHRPIQTFKILRLLARHMSLGALLHLLIKPFLGQKSGTTKAEQRSLDID